MAQSIAFSSVFNWVAMMDQSVHHGDQKPFIREDPIPLCQRKISSQDNAAPFVAVGDDVEEQARTGYVSGELSPLINNQQINIICQNNFRHSSSLTRSGKIYDMRRSS
jgi:hypothetical protein